MLDENVRKGVQRMLAQAVEAEVEQYLQEHASCLDPNSRRRVVSNGRMLARQLQTCAGPLQGRPSEHVLEEVFLATLRQRCRVHTPANVLAKPPKKRQAKSMVQEIYLSAAREDPEKAYADFIDLYEAK